MFASDSTSGSLLVKAVIIILLMGEKCFVVSSIFWEALIVAN